MVYQRTFTMIKPDAVSKNHIGAILAMYEAAGLKILQLKIKHLTRAEGEAFYAVHKERPFFGELVDFITSGPVVLIAIAGENSVAEVRRIMGATDPKKADAGTIRALYAESIASNAIHGSDSPENAEIELRFFFPEHKLRIR